MREILYRGKRQDNREWVYGAPIEKYGKTYLSAIQSFAHTTYNQESVFDFFTRAYQVIPETVGQYTGLTDKNGVKIFEGDILYDEYNECNCLITFDEGSFCFVDDNVLQSVWGCSMVGFEVIGNKYDNPELL